MQAIEKATHAELFPTLPHGCVVRLGTIGDGSCFFHSLCAILNTRGYLSASDYNKRRIAHDFRCSFQTHFSRKAWNSLQDNFPRHVRRTFQDVKTSFCTPHVWAQEEDIKFVSRHLGMNIIFLQVPQNTLFCFMHGNSQLQPTAVIAWVDGGHFEPVMLRTDAGTLRGVFTAEKDEDIVEGLCTAFKSQCFNVDLAAAPL